MASTAPEAVQKGPAQPLGPIADFADEQPSFAPRPMPRQPNEARSITKVLPMPKASSTGKSARGSATWYCKTG